MVSDWLVGCVDVFLNSDFRLLPTLRMLSAECLQVRGLEALSIDANFIFRALTFASSPRGTS